jgi:predicted TIM-barrel fold metal-dependent hydrolase
MDARWNTIDRYVVISADTHAGADLRDYRPYLPARWHEEFDAWADSYVSPWDDLVEDTANRNWDSDLRLKDLEAEGVAAEVVFPNTIPPFFQTVGTMANPPRTREELERRWAGVQAHHRWLVDFCNAAPGRRRGLIEVFPNDVGAAVEEIHWAAEQGVIAGVLIPAVPPNFPGLDPLYSTVYDPIWQACEATGLPLTNHSGSGGPEYPQDQPASKPVLLYEFVMWSRRTLSHLLLGGAFERFPGLRLVMTEQGGPDYFGRALKEMDFWVKIMRNPDSRTFGLFAGEAAQLPLLPSEYFARNCYVGASFMSPREARHRHDVGVERIMWGCDYPHEEGTAPYTLDCLKATFGGVPAEEVRQMLGGVAADVYGFDLDALTPVAERIGPRLADVHAQPAA